MHHTLLSVSTLLHILEFSTVGRMNQLMKLMDTCQELKRRTLTAWSDDKKQHPSQRYCLSSCVGSPQWYTGTCSPCLNPAAAACPVCPSCAALMSCSKFVRVALVFHPVECFIAIHSPANLPKPQAGEEGLKTHSGAITDQGAKVKQGHLGKRGFWVETMGPKMEWTSTCKDFNGNRWAGSWKVPWNSPSTDWRVCASLHPSLWGLIAQDVRGNFSMRCGTLSASRSQDSPWLLVGHAQCARFSWLRFGVWKVVRFETKSTDNISPEGKGSSQVPEDSPRMVQADVQRWEPTLGCNETSKEIRDCVVYVTVLLLLHRDRDFSPIMKMTVQKRQGVTRWQQRVRKVSCWQLGETLGLRSLHFAFPL